MDAESAHRRREYRHCRRFYVAPGRGGRATRRQTRLAFRFALGSRRVCRLLCSAIARPATGSTWRAGGGADASTSMVGGHVNLHGNRPCIHLFLPATSHQDHRRAVANHPASRRRAAAGCTRRYSACRTGTSLRRRILYHNAVFWVGLGGLFGFFHRKLAD
mgnify:CR=1 FL=1